MAGVYFVNISNPDAEGFTWAARMTGPDEATIAESAATTISEALRDVAAQFERLEADRSEESRHGVPAKPR